MSNTERQRRFRERNPGYYQRLHAKRRAQVKAYGEQLVREKALRAIISPVTPLCLPAPDQVSVQCIDFIAMVRAREAEAVAASAARVPEKVSGELSHSGETPVPLKTKEGEQMPAQGLRSSTVVAVL